MTDLTEQLYAGTLPTGHYYFNNGVETYIVLYSNANTKDRKMQEPSGLTVISEVQSCEEWKKAYECVVSENEEITTLKKLLKECKEMLKKSITYQCMDRANHYIKKIENDIYEPILAKIDEVLK